jgi:hypothetical protein
MNVRLNYFDTGYGARTVKRKKAAAAKPKARTSSAKRPAAKPRAVAKAAPVARRHAPRSGTQSDGVLWIYYKAGVSQAQANRAFAVAMKAGLEPGGAGYGDGEGDSDFSGPMSKVLQSMRKITDMRVRGLSALALDEDGNHVAGTKPGMKAGSYGAATVHCVREGGKLRVKPALGQGYDQRLNVQFPRDLRVAGRKFVVGGLQDMGTHYRVVGEIREV